MSSFFCPAAQPRVRVSHWDRRPWGEDELAAASTMWAAGVPLADIGAALGRGSRQNVARVLAGKRVQGRKSQWTAEQIAEAHAMRAVGASFAAIGAKLGGTASGIRRAMNRAEAPKVPQRWQRKCLCCGAQITSTSPYIRMCAPCRSAAS